MVNSFHQEILKLIKQKSGKATTQTFLDSYLGNSHPRYAIDAPTLRAIAKDWMRNHRDLSARAFADLLTSLIEGESSTEKVMAGILLGYSRPEQRTFDPNVFDQWLNHLEGWAEVDAVCTGAYTISQLPADWKNWKKLVTRFSKGKNINKQRASLVLFCSTLRYTDDEQLAQAALKNVDRLKSEKEVLITKAISWVLRSMVKNFKPLVSSYIKKHEGSLPKIALRETRLVLKSGKKTK